MWVIRIYLFGHLSYSGERVNCLKCYWRGDCPTDLLAHEIRRAKRYGESNKLTQNCLNYHVVFGRE